MSRDGRAVIFGEFLRERLRRLKMSPYQLARKIGEYSSIYSHIRGEKFPKDVLKYLYVLDPFRESLFWDYDFIEKFPLRRKDLRLPILKYEEEISANDFFKHLNSIFYVDLDLGDLGVYRFDRTINAMRALCLNPFPNWTDLAHKVCSRDDKYFKDLVSGKDVKI